MKRKNKYDHNAYCGLCQRWILKKALVASSSGARVCPNCHNRVRLKQHSGPFPEATVEA